MQLVRAFISLWLVMVIIRNMTGRVRQQFTLLWWLEMMILLSLPAELVFVLKILRPQQCSNCGTRLSYQQLLKMDSFHCPHCGNKHFEDNTGFNRRKQ